MKEYEFTLKLKLAEPESQPEKHLNALAEAGCTDALIGIGQAGKIALNFIREAPSAYEAISSALAEIRTAIPDSELVEASPDFVGLTDLAEILGFSRQNMRQLVLRNGTFPAPIHEGKAAIWHLAKVLNWLKQHKPYSLNETLLETAQVTLLLNLARETREIEPALQAKIKALPI